MQVILLNVLRLLTRAVLAGAALRHSSTASAVAALFSYPKEIQVVGKKGNFTK